MTQPQKPASLPEQPQPGDTPPSAGVPFEEPPISEEDTQPRPAASETSSLIPAPSQPVKTGRVIRRRGRTRQRQGAWATALIIAALLSLLILLVGLVVLMIYVPEYADPFIPGRVASRTAEALNMQATEDSRATQAAAFQATQDQIVANVAATGTAAIQQADQRATQNALNAEGTAYSLVQTATGGALAFDATRTSVALQSQSTAAINTLEAVRFQFTQTAGAQQAQGTAVASTAAAFVPDANVTAVDTEPDLALIPTSVRSRFNIYFEDDFDDGLNPAWSRQGDWRSIDGAAFNNICGTSIQVGNPNWTDFTVQVDVGSASGGQYAVLLGYGETGQLYVNFGLGGAIWWLVDGAPAIPDEMQANAYQPQPTNRIRVQAEGRVVSVYVNDELVTERLVPLSVHGPVGLYTCPVENSIPLFDNFRVERLR